MRLSGTSIFHHEFLLSRGCIPRSVLSSSSICDDDKTLRRRSVFDCHDDLRFFSFKLTFFFFSLLNCVYNVHISHVLLNIAHIKSVIQCRYICTRNIIRFKFFFFFKDKGIYIDSSGIRMLFYRLIIMFVYYFITQ